MAVSAIQKDTNNNSHKNMSYVKSAAAGALIGYSLKWALPITPQEKDERFNAELDAISAKAKAAEAKEFENIRNIEPKTLATDTFIKLYDSNKLNDSDIKSLTEPLSTQVMDLKNRVNDKTKMIKQVGEKTLNSFTKSIRPAGSFIVTGLGIAVGIAFVHNVLSRINENNKKTEA